MFELIKNLKIGKKLNLLSLGGVSCLVLVAIMVVFILSSVNKQRKKMENFYNIRISIEGIRTNYNSVRGDILLLFILDPSTEPAEVEKTNKYYLEKVKSLRKHTKDLLNYSLDEEADLNDAAKKLVSSTNTFLEFAEKNKDLITNIGSNDDSLHQIVKQQIVYKFDPIYKKILVDKDALMLVLEGKMTNATANVESANTNGRWIVVIVCLITSVFFFVFSRYVGKVVAVPVLEVKEILSKISEGELPKVADSDQNNEIGEMVGSLQSLVNELDNLKQFTLQVGSGKFDADIQIFKNRGDIANSLFAMRENLRVSADADSKRNWLSTGLAQTTILLRKDYKDSKELFSGVLSFAIKYLSANQGSFFIVNNDSSNSTHLEMVACWAYSRQKFLSKTVQPGEGILGQAYLEKDIVYLKEIPIGYLNITSGLGDAPPRNLIVVPLINNDVVQGVIELASFNLFEDYQIDFLKQFADVIASVIASEKINFTTQKLLQSSQQQTEELRSQEEEMRQNMEELSATQEEMNRRQAEIQEVIDALRAENELLRKG
jgi:hypothetical protein